MSAFFTFETTCLLDKLDSILMKCECFRLHWSLILFSFESIRNLIIVFVVDASQMYSNREDITNIYVPFLVFPLFQIPVFRISPIQDVHNHQYQADHVVDQLLI